jgi:hypothetical protein
VQTLQRLVSAYDDYDCGGRKILTFNTTPFLYYLFDVDPPRGLEYIFMPYFFDRDLLLRTLRDSRDWCVFVSWNAIASPAWLETRRQAEPVMQYLNEHSDPIVPLAIGSHPVHRYDDFVLYVSRTSAWTAPADDHRKRSW